MKLVKIKYKTPRGITLENYFLETIWGYKAVYLDDGYLDKSNEILEIKEVESIK